MYSDDEATFNGTYFLDGGISQMKDCVLTYTKNWMSIVTMIAGIFCAPLEGVSPLLSGAISVGATTAVSTWIDSYKAVCNHDVHVGNLVWSSVNTAIGNIMMYGMGYKIGKYVYDKFIKEPAPELKPEVIRDIREGKITENKVIKWEDIEKSRKSIKSYYKWRADTHDRFMGPDDKLIYEKMSGLLKKVKRANILDIQDPEYIWDFGDNGQFSASELCNKFSESLERHVNKVEYGRYYIKFRVDSNGLGYFYAEGAHTSAVGLLNAKLFEIYNSLLDTYAAKYYMPKNIAGVNMKENKPVVDNNVNPVENPITDKSQVLIFETENNPSLTVDNSLGFTVVKRPALDIPLKEFEAIKADIAKTPKSGPLISLYSNENL